MTESGSTRINIEIKTNSQKTRERAMSLPAALLFNQEIAQYSKQKMYDQACQVFEKMIRSGVRPDVVTYNTMINVLVKSQRLNDAFDLFGQMKASGIAPTIVTYTSLIDGCGKNQNLQKALFVYQEAKGSEIELNLHFFNAIINAGCLNENLPLVDLVLVDMSLQGFANNSVTYNTLLNGYLRMNQLSRLMDTIHLMIINKEEFTSSAITTIYQSTSLLNTRDDVKKYIELLIGTRILVGKPQTTLLISDLIKAKKLNPAFCMIELFIGKRIEFDISIMNDLASLAGEYANFKVINWISEYIASNKYPMSVISSQIHAFSRIGNINQVRSLLSDKQTSLNMITPESKMSVIMCFLASKDFDSATKIVDSLLIDGSITANISERLIMQYFDQKNYEMVIKIYMNSRKNVFSVSPKSVDCVIESYMNTKLDIEIVSQLKPTDNGIIYLAKHLPDNLFDRIAWDLLVENPEIRPQSSLLFDLMVTLISKDLLSAAWAAFKKYITSGIAPSENSIELALQTQKDVKNHGNIMLIYDSARDCGIIPSTSLITAAISSSINIGNISEAFQFVAELESSHIVVSDINVSLKSALEILKRSLPSSENIPEMKQAVKNRPRSHTCPRITNKLTGMEEISNRSAFIVLESGEI